MISQSISHNGYYIHENSVSVLTTIQATQLDQPAPLNRKINPDHIKIQRNNGS